MRKIYSLVLMATMLLMGTNVKAVDVKNWSELSTALAGSATEITLIGNIAMPDDGQIAINGGKSLVLNLNGFSIAHNPSQASITAKTATSYPILLDGGNLTINGNGTISSTYYAVVKVVGSYYDVANYSVMTVNTGVNMTSEGSYAFVVAQAKVPGTTSNSNHGYGIVINFDGTLTASGNEGTAFWVLGNIKDTEGHIPQIIIGPHAVLTGADNGVGYYAGGYAENTIQGSVSGGAGIYAKAGEIIIDGGTVQATSTTYSNPTANGNGFSGGMGCAIVSDSHKGYQGEMEIVITGTATIGTSATEGYAIKEVVTDNNNQTKTESLVIESGTINGDLNTTAELKENIILNGTITGGTYTGNVTEYLNDEATNYEIVDGKYVIKVAVDVKLNSYGYATFSAKKNVDLPATGLTVWKATELSGTDLVVEAVAGAVIPANTGVILVGEANGQFTLTETATAASAIADNLMKPATAWSASYVGNAYILHDNELWLYNGNEFKANKAFFVFSGSSAAPKRLRMVLNQTETPTAVENVETQNVKAVKFVGEDGQLYIRRGEAVYTVQGQVVK